MLASVFTSFSNPYSYQATIRAADVNVVVTGRGEFFAELTRIGLVAAMLASRDFKGIRRKRLPIFMLGVDHAFQASFER